MNEVYTYGKYPFVVEDYYGDARYVERVRKFLILYLKRKNMPHPGNCILSWPDDQVMDFVNKNFEFFFSTSHPNLILALPRCSFENEIIQSLMIPF